jgi:hypothetical protein
MKNPDVLSFHSGELSKISAGRGRRGRVSCCGVGERALKFESVVRV